MNARINPDNLKRLINSELDLANQLQSLLQKENDVLSQRNFIDLPAITEHKIRLVQQLENHAKQRTDLATSTGQSDPKEWQNIMIDSDAELKASWLELKHELDMCSRINHINELVVNRSLKATQRVLNIIRGGSIEQNLYSKQGNKIKARAVGSYLSV
jgi:flagella synthesis protein FlgN